MTNRLIATILAASVALTAAFSAPARAADSGEIGRLLLGAGALIIIGTELSRNNGHVVTRRYVEPPRRRAVVTHRYVERPRHRHGRRHYETRRHGHSSRHQNYYYGRSHR